MSKKTNRYALFLVAILCIGCGTLFAFFSRNESALPPKQLSERINLSLRRTAHLLLKQAGDSTSTIPPVTQTGEQTYSVRLEHPFNYDSLPTFLQNSFELNGITEKYDVSVLDCAFQQLLLGYSSHDLLDKGGVPCVGRVQTAFENVLENAAEPFSLHLKREQAKACLNFSVTFSDPSVKSVNWTYLLFFLGGLLSMALVAIPYFFLKKTKELQPVLVTDTPQSINESAETHLIYIGKTVFDTKNQILLIDNIEQKLTFQESKLLQLFCQHKNELLDRDFILKAVWDDDGVLVSRSVDVFISRLRKLLKTDETLKIVNVHSRGYRLETIF